MINPMTQCPRFERCSANKCPLDMDAELRGHIPDDPVCTLSKARRIKIGAGTDLPMQGYTKREWSYKLAWEAKSEDERVARMAELRANAPLRPSKRK